MNKGFVIPGVIWLIVTIGILAYAGTYFYGTASVASVAGGGTVSTSAPSHSCSEVMSSNGITIKVCQSDFLDNLLRPGAIISGSCSAGGTVNFDSRGYMDCGRCDVSRYQTTIKGYTIKVFNPAGNMVSEQSFSNPTASWGLLCGGYGNIAYTYTVPQDAASGTWKIRLEIAVAPSNPFGNTADCIVFNDEATFTVGSTCADYGTAVGYCYSDLVLLTKPANSCSRTYLNCGDTYGTGFKCLNAKCQKVEVCGDKICDDLENPYNCYVDCGYCGDNLCTGTENSNNCPLDCSTCGDGRCDSREQLGGCLQDCGNIKCGDKVCEAWEKSGTYYCKQDCGAPAPEPSNALTDWLVNIIVSFVLGSIVVGIVAILGLIFAPLRLVFAMTPLRNIYNPKSFLIASFLVGLIILFIWAGVVMSFKASLMGAGI